MPSTLVNFLYSMHHTIFCSHKLFYLFSFIRIGSTKINPKNGQNRSSALGPGHLNPMDVLKNALPQEFLQGFFQQLYGFYFLIP